MYLYLVAIAWVYVVLLMAATEHTVVAGVMTFLLYCVVPLTVILYLMGTPRRKRKRLAEESARRALTPATDVADKFDAPEPPEPSLPPTTPL